MTADPRDETPRRERLRRLERIFAQSPIYFVTACTFDRRGVLTNNAVHRAFLDFAKAGERHGAYLGAYVIMPDHVHFFVMLDRDETLSSWMKSLKNSVSKALRYLQVSPPHWQKGFFDHVLRSSESYSQKWEYVRGNPVRAGLARSWEDWPYSGELWRLDIANNALASAVIDRRYNTLRRVVVDDTPAFGLASIGAADSWTRHEVRSRTMRQPAAVRRKSSVKIP
jgi:REP element-mobilizing transposase RayT